MVKKGDTVKINGIVSKITGRWGQGKHSMYQLEDGRVVADISDETIQAPVIKPDTKKPFRRHSVNGEDFED